MVNRQSKSEIAHDILAYLSSNPEAQDTLTGIVEWWLLEEQIKRRSEAVTEAVAELVSNGFIIETIGKDTQIHYRINREKAQEIIALLNRDQEDPE